MLTPNAGPDTEIADGRPVIPRMASIEYMQANFAQFQFALAMLDRMYDDLDLDVTYRRRLGCQNE